MDHNDITEIHDLVRMLDKAIHKHMGELNKIGREIKELQKTTNDDSLLHSKYVQMATVFNNLKPAEDRVRYLYPHMKMNELFDYLMQVHASETLANNLSRTICLICLFICIKRFPMYQVVFWQPCNR